MGDLERDLTLEPAKPPGGGLRAQLSGDWRIWGPNGGYLASLALCAAVRESDFDVPASLSCHFLGVGRFEPVDLAVTSLRRGRHAESLRVDVAQEGRALLQALVWTTDEPSGLAHDDATPPEVPDPGALRPMDELVPEPHPYPFWHNLESRPLAWQALDERRAGPPRVAGWYRYRPRARFASAVLEASRALILADTLGWPAAHQAHVGDERFIAPSLDVSVQFHRPPAGEWLLCEAHAPVADRGRIGFRSRVWCEERRLVASGGGTLLCRPAPAGV